MTIANKIQWESREL